MGFRFLTISDGVRGHSFSGWRICLMGCRQKWLTAIWGWSRRMSTSSLTRYIHLLLYIMFTFCMHSVYILFTSCLQLAYYFLLLCRRPGFSGAVFTRPGAYGPTLRSLLMTFSTRTTGVSRFGILLLPKAGRAIRSGVGPCFCTGTATTLRRLESPERKALRVFGVICKLLARHRSVVHVGRATGVFSVSLPNNYMLNFSVYICLLTLCLHPVNYSLALQPKDTVSVDKPNTGNEKTVRLPISEITRVSFVMRSATRPFVEIRMTRPARSAESNSCLPWQLTPGSILFGTFYPTSCTSLLVSGSVTSLRCSSENEILQNPSLAKRGRTRRTNYLWRFVIHSYILFTFCLHDVCTLTLLIQNLTVC